MVDQITPVDNPSTTQAGFNIDKFVAAVNSAGGVAKTNRFMLRIPTLPASFAGNLYLQGLTATQRQLEFFCEGAAIPGIAVATHTGIRYGYGSAEKRPFTPVFNDFNLSVICDDQQNNMFFWKMWLQTINNFDMSSGINPSSANNLISVNNIPSYPFELSYRSEYVTNIQLIVFDSTGNPSTVVCLREAFPIFVSDSAVNWGDSNNILRLPISINYVDWYLDLDAMRNGV